MKYLTLSHTLNTCVIPAPQWGYGTTVTMAFKPVRNKYTGDVQSWDNGVGCDTRVCSAKFILTATEATNFSDFLELVGGGRNTEFTVDPDSGAGFYMYGPNYAGDGSLFATEVTNSRSSRLLRPHGLFEFSVDFMDTFELSEELPTEIDMDSTVIGVVDGIPFIKDIDLTYVKGWSLATSEGGKPLYISNGSSGVYTDCQITFELNRSKAAALVHHIVKTVRNNTFQIQTQSNTYLFGAENNSSGTYNVKLNSNILKITHGAVDRFMISLDIHLVGIE